MIIPILIPQMFTIPAVINFAARRAARLFRTGKTRQPAACQVASDGPRDCVLVLDASPSMLATDWKPSRIAAAQEAAKAYVARLAREEPSARVAVVGYGGEAYVLCDLTPASNQSALEQAIDGLRVIDATNITAGLEIADRILASARPSQQVIVLSDGHHNTGPRPCTIATEIKKHAVVECVGIGGCPSDVDEAQMKVIASSYPDGRKRYRWIGDKERLVQHFHHLAGRITKAPC